MVPHCQVLCFRVHPSKRLSTDEAQRRETALYDDAREPDEATVTAARELAAAYAAAAAAAAAADGGGTRTKSSQSTSCASATTCPEQLTVWTEEVLQWWYRTFPVVPVECRESRASVPASVVPGHILGSWGQLCCCCFCCCCCCCCCYDKSSTPISESFCDIRSSLRRVRRPTSFVTTSPHHIAAAAAGNDLQTTSCVCPSV